LIVWPFFLLISFSIFYQKDKLNFKRSNPNLVSLDGRIDNHSTDLGGSRLMDENDIEDALIGQMYHPPPSSSSPSQQQSYLIHSDSLQPSCPPQQQDHQQDQNQPSTNNSSIILGAQLVKVIKEDEENENEDEENEENDEIKEENDEMVEDEP